VLLQRLDPGFHNVSLHHIKLKANFATRQVVVGVGPTLYNVSFDSTSLVSMIPACNKVSSSSRGLFMAKVTAHSVLTPVFV
jgi:hypothetical protein